MGCGGSRFDKRKDNAGDLYTVGTNFVGGEAHTDDLCPCDKVCFAYAKEEKEPKEIYKVTGLKAEDEEIMKKIATDTHTAVKAHLAYLESEYGKPQDGKTIWVGGRYTLNVAHFQLKKVLKEIEEHSGFTFEEEKKEGEEETKEEGKEEEKMDEMMEGGDEMMGMMEEDPYAGDSDDYKGFANFPKLLLRLCTVYPFFGDLVKSDTIHFEFNTEAKGMIKLPPLNPLAFIKKGPSNGVYAGPAGILSYACDTAESGEKEIWFAGYAGENDYESLKGIAEAKGPIMFPGLVSGWDNQEKALKEVEGEIEGKQD